MIEKVFKTTLIEHLVDAHNKFVEGIKNNWDRHEIRELAAASGALADLFVDLYGVDELDKIAKDCFIDYNE